MCSCITFKITKRIKIKLAVEDETTQENNWKKQSLIQSKRNKKRVTKQNKEIPITTYLYDWYYNYTQHGSGLINSIFVFSLCLHTTIFFLSKINPLIMTMYENAMCIKHRMTSNTNIFAGVTKKADLKEYTLFRLTFSPENMIFFTFTKILLDAKFIIKSFCISTLK